MQLYVLLLILAVVMPYELEQQPTPQLYGWPMVAAALGPYLVPLLASVLMCLVAERRINRQPQRVNRTLKRLQNGLLAMQFAALGVTYAVLLVLGWGTWLADTLGPTVLVVELVVLAPALAVPIVAWWAYYPIDRRLHEAALVRRLDEGLPVNAVPTRAAYVWGQVRHQLLLLLLPMLLILAWGQTLHWHIRPRKYEELYAIVGGLAIFSLAPLVIRFVWDTTPIAPGPLRDGLLAMCRRHRVRVSELLLWRTHTGMINGAVMGLFGRLRYILLTDGLIEQLTGKQVEAVMAHELGHVRRRHMVWLAVCAFATIGVTFSIAEQLHALGERLGLYDPLLQRFEQQNMGGTDARELIAALFLLAGAVAWALVFGWISRRFERQADTFAAQHLTPPDSPHITEEAAESMAGALLAVAHLNHAPTDRKSWRHGSIDWRVNYLRRLPGTPTDACHIDRVVRRTCWACAALLIASAAWQWWAPAGPAKTAADAPPLVGYNPSP